MLINMQDTQFTFGRQSYAQCVRKGDAAQIRKIGRMQNRALRKGHSILSSRTTMK
jgi:hypothetical protein